jgi:lipopolysaccharide biosynthesis glycosyltransferase
MNIVYSGNANYFPHIGISITSLVRHNKPTNVYLLTDMNSSLQSAELLKYSKSIGININVIIVNLASSSFRISKKIPIVAYYRLLLPDLLPDIDKVIYLDGDIIINNSIEFLWNLNLQDNFIAAVEELEINKSLKINLFGTEAPYFNSGVLVMDLQSFRKHKLTNLMLDFAANHKEKIIYHDQCTLNYFLQNKWLKLSATYNFMSCHFRNEQYSKEIPEPIVIHYNNYYGKPWDHYCLHPLKNLYLEIRSTTPWRTNKLTKKDWLSFYRRKYYLFDKIIAFLRKIVNQLQN